MSLFLALVAGIVSGAVLGIPGFMFAFSWGYFLSASMILSRQRELDTKRVPARPTLLITAITLLALLVYVLASSLIVRSFASSNGTLFWATSAVFDALPALFSGGDWVANIDDLAGSVSIKNTLVCSWLVCAALELYWIFRFGKSQAASMVSAARSKIVTRHKFVLSVLFSMFLYYATVYLSYYGQGVRSVLFDRDMSSLFTHASLFFYVFATLLLLPFASAGFAQVSYIAVSRITGSTS